jgi:hypothetical protein
MFRKLFLSALCLILSLIYVQNIYSQELGNKDELILEENIEKGSLAEIDQKPEPTYVTTDILNTQDVEPAINYYIRSDINRKFSGLTTNLKLEKVYGIYQEGRTASVYFDYSYTPTRNRENVLHEKGKMTFMKFNSNKWFNQELSIFLMDSYPAVSTVAEPQNREE